VTELFRKRATTVEARHVDAGDWNECEAIADWAGAHLVDYGIRSTNVTVIMTLRHPSGWTVDVDDGDWIVHDGSAFLVFHDAAFRANFQHLVVR